MVLQHFLSFLLLVRMFVPTTLGAGPSPNQINTLVTFGDSYTDVYQISNGGTQWPVYAADYGNFTLYPFAKSGATCSNKLTPRPFSSVTEGQLPDYYQSVANGSVTVDPETTVYTLWIGTNDNGANAVLTGEAEPGVTIVNTTACATNWVQELYDHGARNFVFQNMLPLELTPMYAPYSWPNGYWSAQRNTTEWNIFMTNLVASGNTLARYMLQDIIPNLPGAHVGLFDSYGLFQDMYLYPGNYLNGTVPYNVTGAVRACVVQTNGVQDCTVVSGSAKDSYLWYDEVHPSEQADRVVARTITNAIIRKSDAWINWLS